MTLLSFDLMELREKLKTFLEKQKHHKKGSHISSSLSLSDFESCAAGIQSSASQRKLSLPEFSLTPEAEDVIIDTIEPIYFEKDGKDVSIHELSKIPEVIDLQVINGVRSRLRKQQAVVSRKVTNLIVEKEQECKKEMDYLAQLQKELCLSIELCKKGRSLLMKGRSEFTVASLGILANYGKRENIGSVIHSLRTIKTIQMTEVQLQSLLRAGDYPGAIQLLLELEKTAEMFKHFACISDLSKKIQEILELTEEKLDGALSRIAINFTSSSYEKIFMVYDLLGKSQRMMDQLHMHLTSHIHNLAFTVVLGYVELCKDSNGNAQSNSITFSKLQYTELCKYMHEETFLSCFLALSKAMWNILRNYKNIIKWHQDQDALTDSEEGKTDRLSQKYIKQKLEHGLIRIWQDAQAKFRTLILAVDISHFKFDDFIKVLDLINTLIDVGESFCGSKSETLHEAIKKQSLSYFHRHHLSRLEELHMFLENEVWQLCPVKHNFTISHLPEYKFLKVTQNYSEVPNPLMSPKKLSGVLHKKIDWYNLDSNGPFDISLIALAEEQGIRHSNESDDDELHRNNLEDEVSRVSQSDDAKEFENPPVVTNTTLTLLKLFGHYIQMMQLLQPIAVDVTRSLCELFEYYFFTVFKLFGKRTDAIQTLSSRLKSSLEQIENNLICTLSCDEQNRVSEASLSPVVDLHSSASLFGLSHRIVAVESLAFLCSQLMDLQSYIEVNLPATQKIFLVQFFNNSVKIVPEVRYHVYNVVANQVVDYEGILQRMTSVKWDISDLMSEPNSYVNYILEQFNELKLRLSSMEDDFPIPPEASETLWENVLRITNKTILEGFSVAKKCSNEGRSLMQLDYQQFLMKLDQFTPVKPVPKQQLVEAYVKAYYLPECSLEEWIVQNSNKYSTKQITSLLSVMAHISKKTRQKIALLLEENAKNS